MRRGVGSVVVACALLVACGDDGSDIALDSVVAIEPCDLLGAEDAARLVGGEVEAIEDAPVGTGLATAVGCSYRPVADDSAETGSAVAASLVIGETTESPELAVDARLAELAGPAGAPAGPVERRNLADGGAVVRTVELVHVVYVVQTVVVSVAIKPVDGVDEETATTIVDFAESTVEPVKRAVEEKNRGEGRLVVPSTANLFLALQDEAPENDEDGTLPPSLELDTIDGDGPLRFEVQGAVNCCAGEPTGTADGQVGSSGISGVDGIAGFVGDRQLPLLGLFLGEEPPDAPAATGETQLADRSEIEPSLGVPFFIGDGLDAEGELATVTVPDGATRLVFGFADAPGFGGAPGSYLDNRGAVRVSLTS